MKGLSNISVREYRMILSKLGLTLVRRKGGHEAWMKQGMTRPVVFQTHIDPIPEFVVRNNLRNMNVSKETFIALRDAH